MLAALFIAVISPALPAADAACTGTVTVIDRTYTFPEGRIDWKKDPFIGKCAYNPEWIWQLNRMAFWSSLVKAYQATHDEKYARAFAAQLTGWLDQTGGVPPEDGYNGQGSAFRTIEEGIRLMGSWHDAWSTFTNSPAFTPALQARFCASALAQAQHLLRHPSPRGNWLMMEMNGVYGFATLFADLPEAPEMRRAAAKRLSDEVREQVLPDGVHYELSPDYHSVTMGCASQMYARALKYGFDSELPDDFAPILARMAEGTIALMTPGFVQPRFNDCFTLHTDQMVSRVASYFPARKDFLWAATRGEKGAPPSGATASRFLPWSGFAVMRSGWDAEATYLCFDVGPLSMGHEHQDKLSFTLWKGGEELVFDDGGGQYEHSPARAYGVSGYDHNTLLVDGLAQRRREPKRVTAPIDAGWRTSPTEDFAFGVYDQGFGADERKLARQRREITFEKANDLFVVRDEIRSADGLAHDYELLFQLDTTNVVRAADGRTLLADYGAGRRWRLEMTFEGADDVVCVQGRTQPTMAGWFVGRNGMTVHVATTVFVRKAATKDHIFTTRLKPRAVK